MCPSIFQVWFNHLYVPLHLLIDMCPLYVVLFLNFDLCHLYVNLYLKFDMYHLYAPSIPQVWQSVAKESWHFILALFCDMDGAKIVVFVFLIIQEDFYKFWYQTWTNYHNYMYVQLVIYSLIMRGYKIVRSQITLHRN